MDIKRKIVASLAQRFISLLTLEQLKRIKAVEENSKHASYQLSLNAQIAAQDTAKAVSREIVGGLYDNQFEEIENALLLALTHLEAHTSVLTPKS